MPVCSSHGRRFQWGCILYKSILHFKLLREPGVCTCRRSHVQTIIMILIESDSFWSWKARLLHACSRCHSGWSTSLEQFHQTARTFKLCLVPRPHLSPSVCTHTNDNAEKRRALKHRVRVFHHSSASMTQTEELKQRRLRTQLPKLSWLLILLIVTG